MGFSQSEDYGSARLHPTQRNTLRSFSLNGSCTASPRPFPSRRCRWTIQIDVAASPFQPINPTSGFCSTIQSVAVHRRCRRCAARCSLGLVNSSLSWASCDSGAAVTEPKFDGSCFGCDIPKVVASLKSSQYPDAIRSEERKQSCGGIGPAPREGDAVESEDLPAQHTSTSEPEGSLADVCQLCSARPEGRTPLGLPRVFTFARDTAVPPIPKNKCDLF